MEDLPRQTKRRIFREKQLWSAVNFKLVELEMERDCMKLGGAAEAETLWELTVMTSRLAFHGEGRIARIYILGRSQESGLLT